MKQHSGSRKLSANVFLWGFAALVLRMALYATAVDVKGLLLRNHPLGIVLTVLTIGVLIRIALAVRKQENCLADTDQSGLIPAFGSLAAGAGILITVQSASSLTGSYLELAWRCLGLAAPVCLVLAGVAQILKKKPFFLLHVVVCLFFVVHIVTRYQLWSSNPQMQDYVFSMLGAMALMFFGFYTAAREADCGNPRMLAGMGLAAVYLCFAELARSSCPWLYLGGMVWVLTGLCCRGND